MIKELMQSKVDALGEAKEQISPLLVKYRNSQNLHRQFLEEFHDGIQKIVNKVKNNYLAQVNGMAADSERVQKSILDLLDLQQKEANIDEAHSSNQTANAVIVRPRRCDRSTATDNVHIHICDSCLSATLVLQLVLWY